MQKRIYKFDNLKFLLIFLVVLGHFIDFYTGNSNVLKMIFIFIYSFHMPLFIFLTGLFSKKITKYKDDNYKKIFFYFFIAMLMKFSIFLISNHTQQEGFQLFGGNDIYWFLFVISIYYLLIPIINKINKKYLLIFSFLIALFVGYDDSINSFLYLSRIIVFFPFFLVGYYLSDKKDLVVSYTERKYVKIICYLILFVFILFCVFKLDLIYQYRMLFTGKNPYSWVAIINCNYKNRIISYIIQFLIGFSILSIVPNKNIKHITNFGARTFQVYALHVPIVLFIQQLKFINNLLVVNKNLFYILCFIISLILTLLLSTKIIEKIFERLKRKLFS